jgi:hypothetical protein
MPQVSQGVRQKLRRRIHQNLTGVGVQGLEPWTSVLSGLRSNHLS